MVAADNCENFHCAKYSPGQLLLREQIPLPALFLNSDDVHASNKEDVKEDLARFANGRHQSRHDGRAGGRNRQWHNNKVKASSKKMSTYFWGHFQNV